MEDGPMGSAHPDLAGPGVTTKDYTLLHVRASTQYLRGFPVWLDLNWHIWERFRVEADAIRARGRAHYAARTIAEYLRHQTMLREAADFEFKLNNNNVPDLARLYMTLNPAAAGFFHLRGRE